MIETKPITKKEEMKDEKKSNISVTRSSDGNYIGCWLRKQRRRKR